MPRPIDTGALRVEDLVWTDTQGKNWLIPGDTTTEEAFDLLGAVDAVSEAEDKRQPLLDLSAKVHALFAHRHSQEELKGLRIPAGRLVSLALGIVRGLSDEAREAAQGPNPPSPEPEPSDPPGDASVS